MEDSETPIGVIILSQDACDDIDALWKSKSKDFVELALTAGLNLSTSFVDVDLSDIDFGTSDLSEVNMTGTLVSREKISRAKLPTNPEWHPIIID